MTHLRRFARRSTWAAGAEHSICTAPGHGTRLQCHAATAQSSARSGNGVQRYRAVGATGHAGCAPAAGGDAALPVSQLFAHAGALCAGGSEGGAEGGGEAVTRRQPGHEVVVTALQYLVAPRGGSGGGGGGRGGGMHDASHDRRGRTRLSRY